MTVPHDLPADVADRDTAAAPGAEAEAIFIVGVSRSGTTLLRRVLDSHSRIAIAPENHFLGHLLPWEGARQRLRSAGDLAEDATIARWVELLYSPAFQEGSRLRAASPFWRWVKRNVPPSELEARLLAADRSERGMFAALLRLYADRRGKAIVGEKTPAHVGWADTLLEWYPRGRIVHMMRDPRAVYVSELRRRREDARTFPYRWLIRVPPLFRWFVLGEVAWAWAGAVGRHRTLARTHPDGYRLVRFEDLVDAPEVTVDALCTFLGVVAEPAMLQQEVTSKGAMLGQSGFDAGAATRWRESIRPSEASWLRRLLGRRIDEMGYPRT